MNEEQREKYRYVLDMLSMEQQKELNYKMEILNQAIPEKRITIRITIKGQTYYTFIWQDPAKESSKKLRIIVGIKGWTFSPVDRPIKKCLLP